MHVDHEMSKAKQQIIMENLKTSAHDILTTLENQLNNDDTKEKLCFAFKLIDTFTKDKFLQTIPNIGELLLSTTRFFLSNINLNKTIGNEELISFSQFVIGNLNKLMNTFLSHNVEDLPIQLTQNLIICYMAFQSLPQLKNLNDLPEFVRLFNKLFKCFQINEILNKTIIKAITEFIKSQKTKEVEWTLQYGNAILWHYLVYHIK